MTAWRGLDARLRLARLLLVTDARERQGDLAAFLTAAFAGGVDIVQLRDSRLDPDAASAALAVARRAAAPSHAIVAVHASVRLSGEDGTDMLHLGAADPVRRPHPSALVGRSVHDLDQLAAALLERDLDYLSVRAASTLGLDLVRQAADLAPVYDLAAPPWFAAGGITPGTVDAVLTAGARRVCVSRAITSASDPGAVAAALSGALRRAWRADPGAERYTFAAAASTGRR